MSAVTTPLSVRQPDAEGIAVAAATLRRGGLVAFPTETVYGLGADATNAAAVHRIFAAKRRPADNPLIVHIARSEDLASVAAEVTPLAAALAEQFWPGPLTLVLPAAAHLPRVTTGGLDTVAVRVPDHPVALAILRATGRPLAAPSANRSGRPSPTLASHVVAELGDEVDHVIDGGPSALGVESTVVDARGPVPIVLRDGGVSREALHDLVPNLGTGDAGGQTQAVAASPGTRYRHYAPRCQVELAARAAMSARARHHQAAGRTVGVVTSAAPPEGTEPILRYRDADHLAAQLYQALRAAEDASVDVLLVEPVDDAGIGRAVMDRLRRAAAGYGAGSGR